MPEEYTRFVTPDHIDKVRESLTADSGLHPLFEQLTDAVPHTTVQEVWGTFPGWGLLGDVIIEGRYQTIQTDFEDMMKDALAALDSWSAALRTCAGNWRTAELDASGMVKYKAL